MYVCNFTNMMLTYFLFEQGSFIVRMLSKTFFKIKKYALDSFKSFSYVHSLFDPQTPENFPADFMLQTPESSLIIHTYL